MPEHRFHSLRRLAGGAAWLAQDELSGVLVVRKQGEELDAEAAVLEQAAVLGYRPGQAASLPELVAFSSDGPRSTLTRAFLPGRTLQELLLEGPLPEARVGRWVRSLARLLASLHGLGHVHGDLSAANVLVTPAGELVLLDWGGGQRSTPAYSAPPAGRPDPKQDVYALGMIWLHALTGRVTEPQHVPSGAPPELYECLRFLPEQRPTASALSERLGRYSEEMFEGLIGREEALERLESSWRTGTATSSLWLGLTAPSGYGKTAFLRELTGRCHSWAWGQVSTLRTPHSLEAFQSLAGTLQMDGLALPGAILGSQRWRLMRAVFPWMPGPLDSQDAQAGALSVAALAEAWSELLSRLIALRRRLLLIFDDVQWIDEQSRQLLASLSERNLPGLMVVVAWRQEHPIPADVKLDHTLTLPPLTVRDLRRWAQRDGRAFSPFQAYAAHGWTHGSPLLIRDWLRAPEEATFSPKVATLLEDRLGSLEPSCLLVLRTAALIGKSFDPAILRFLYGEPCEAALEAATRAQLLLPGEAQRSFAHDRVRERLLEQLDEAERTALHGRLADYFLALEPRPEPDCAHHLVQADRLREAAPLALQAARQEASRLALDSARRFYEISLSSLVDPQAALELSLVLRKLGKALEAEGVLKRELEGCADPVLRVRLLVELLLLYDLTYRYSELDQLSWRFFRQPSLDNFGHWLHAQLLYVFNTQTSGGPAWRWKILVPLALLYLAMFWSRQKLLAANMLSGLPQMGWLWGMDRASAAIMATIDRQQDPFLWGCALSRLDAYRNAECNRTSYVQQLEELDQLLARHTVPEEVCMNAILLGNHYLAQGRFAELEALGARLGAVADEEQRSVALYFQTVSKGGRVPWAPIAAALEAAGPPRANLAYVRLIVAAVTVLLDRGEPRRALSLLDRLERTPAAFDASLLELWRATVTRKYLQRLPRHQRLRRERLLRQAREALSRLLKLTKLMRVYLPHALRERAWLHLLEGRPELARQDFEASWREAKESGSPYEEALTLRDLATVGGELEWPHAAPSAARADQLFAQIGAWWELFPARPGLPVEEVGEAATGCLLTPESPQAWSQLEATGALQLAGDLRSLVAEHGLRQQQAHQEILKLDQENELWRQFLVRGPVLVERRDGQGRVLESNVRETGLSDDAQVVALSDGSRVYLEIPAQRGDYEKLQKLVSLERRLLLQALERDVRPDWPEEIQSAWRELQAWYLDETMPEAPDLRSFLDMAVVADQVRLSELNVAARFTLLSVTREALSNSRKHGDGDLSIAVSRLSSDWILVDFRNYTPARSTTERSGGFGLESMRFRLSLVGGDLSLLESAHQFRLLVRIPLALPAPARL